MVAPHPSSLPEVEGVYQSSFAGEVFSDGIDEPDGSLSSPRGRGIESEGDSVLDNTLGDVFQFVVALDEIFHRSCDFDGLLYRQTH